MATIINNPPERVVAVDGADSSGWAIAVIILLVVVAGGAYAWMRYHPGTAAAPSGGTNINVTVPTPGGTQTQPAQ
ncbi:hypothetical protein EXS62_02570 [Candidatus Kaiserbacteria bacterium]|nr:hypothetical protein [Candidatus Kaiserbacteria bacterium]